MLESAACPMPVNHHQTGTGTICRPDYGSHEIGAVRVQQMAHRHNITGEAVPAAADMNMSCQRRRYQSTKQNQAVLASGVVDIASGLWKELLPRLPSLRLGLIQNCDAFLRSRTLLSMRCRLKLGPMLLLVSGHKWPLTTPFEMNWPWRYSRWHPQPTLIIPR